MSENEETGRPAAPSGELPPFRTVREILGFVQTLHRERMKRYATALQDDQDAARRGALLQFLHHREQQQLAGLARYEQSDDDVLRTQIQGLPSGPLAAAAELDRVVPQDPITIAQDYLRRDRALVQIYEQLASSLVGPRAADIFINLADRTRHNQQLLARALLDL